MTLAGTPANRGKRMSEADFRRLWNDRSITLRQIGDMLGVTIKAVTCRAKSRGLPMRGCGKTHVSPIIPSREAEFRAMWAGKVMSKDMAAHFGVSRPFIPKTARRLGLPPRGHAWCHEGIPLARWREDQIAQAMAADAARARIAMVKAGMHSRNRPQAWAAE